jgi:hypothetical protein
VQPAHVLVGGSLPARVRGAHLHLLLCSCRGCAGAAGHASQAAAALQPACLALVLALAEGGARAADSPCRQRRGG